MQARKQTWKQDTDTAPTRQPLPRTQPAGAARTGAAPRPAGPGAAGLSPAAVTSLQRSAGNGAVSRALEEQRHVHGASCGHGEPAAGARGGPAVVQRRKPSKNAPTEHFATRAEDHPEWPVFRKLMAAGGFPPGVIESAWQLLLGGIGEQERLNTAAADPSLDPAQRRAHRASNTWYRELVDLVGDHLRITTPTMALWSGGFDVSVYAQSKGHTPLEFTRLGKVVDQLELHANWKLQAPLWNVLSRAFVERATGPVHVFLRAYAPDSVLIAQEIPQLRVIQKVNPAVTVMWHPLYTTPDGAIREISQDLRLTDDAAYRSRDKCVALMYQYLLRFHDESNSEASVAYREMNDLLTKNVNPKADKG
ncbi:hypothetical protein ABZ719_00710 [Streptomyces sp. NPDC006743]|uniref:hypothetical protein n=1 Tax=Streptomyces sp. NPDC006743 TaxID=3154480 RepID=UPI00345432C3